MIKSFSFQNMVKPKIVSCFLDMVKLTDLPMNSMVSEEKLGLITKIVIAFLKDNLALKTDNS